MPGPGTDASESSQGPVDRGVRFRDLDGDGRCELLVGNETQNAIFRWSEEEKRWKRRATRCRQIPRS